MMSLRRLATGVIVMIVGVFAVSFVVGNGSMLVDLLDGITAVDPAIALLGAAISVAAMVNRGMLNRAAHRAAGLETDIASMTHTAAVGFAAQKLVKSAGAVGLAVFVRHGRRRGHAAGPVTAACVLTAAGSFVALGVVLGAAVVMLAATGRLTGWWTAAATGFTVYAVVVSVLTAVVLRSRSAATSLWRAARRLRRRLRRPSAAEPTTCTDFPDELFDAVSLARSRPDALRRLLVHAVASKMLGGMMLATAVAAAGLPIDAPGALVIYATALAAAMVTIVPGGIGAVEASTAALLVGAGATAGAAAIAVALFRVFDLWMPLGVGGLLARGELRAPIVAVGNHPHHHDQHHDRSAAVRVGAPQVV